MTAPDPDRDPVSTEVLLLQRARRRRRRARQRRQGLIGATVAVAVVALAGGAAARSSGGGGGGGGGSAEVAAGAAASTSTTEARGTTSSRPAPTSTSAVSTTAAADAPEPVCTSAAMPIEQRAALLVFATVSGGSGVLDEAIADGFGGVFIPKESVGLVADGTVAQRTGAVERPPLVATDEEGGRVQRLAGILGAIPAPRDLHAQGPRAIEDLAAEHGRAMRERGITMDFAPVVDLVDDDQVDGDGGIGDRSFSADPEEAAADAGAFARGLSEAGVLPTYKHFPGHGHSSTDTHDGLGTTPAIDQLRADDLVPYQRLLADGQPTAAVMVGHLAVPGLTGDLPASVSPAAITGLLRDELGFDGLVVTDDLGGMRAIRNQYSTVEAAALAVGAGADMVLVPFGDSAGVIERITAAVADGTIPDAQVTASADRVLRAQQPGACEAG